jgi:hypothetical protein
MTAVDGAAIVASIFASNIGSAEMDVVRGSHAP